MMSVDTSGFQGQTLDKVERLMDLLAELKRHPDLEGKLCMHGGTAINLFMLDVPRLSVDIDLSYIGAAEREKMLADRPLIEAKIEAAANYAGYIVSASKEEHAGRTFRLRYKGDWGSDQIKIDVIYLNRSPLMLPEFKTCYLRPELEILMFSDFELIAGKVKALFDRVAVRDIYDIFRLKQYLDERLVKHSEQSDLCHKIILYYAALSAHFPHSFEGRIEERFSNKESELTTQLYPMLRNDERPTLTELIEVATLFVRDYVLPKDDNEQAYLSHFARADYQPQLLFGNYPEVLKSAQVNPEALWKLQNLQKMTDNYPRKM